MEGGSTVGSGGVGGARPRIKDAHWEVNIVRV